MDTFGEIRSLNIETNLILCYATIFHRLFLHQDIIDEHTILTGLNSKIKKSILKVMLDEHACIHIHTHHY